MATSSTFNFIMRRKSARPHDLDKLLARLDLDATPIKSPCVGICHVHPKTKLCEGCLRTIDEIAEWGAVDDARRVEIWLSIKQRRAHT